MDNKLRRRTENRCFHSSNTVLKDKGPKAQDEIVIKESCRRMRVQICLSVVRGKENGSWKRL